MHARKNSKQNKKLVPIWSPSGPDASLLGTLTTKAKAQAQSLTRDAHGLYCHIIAEGHRHAWQHQRLHCRTGKSTLGGVQN